MEHKAVRCRMCKRVLFSTEAKEVGFGPVCYRKITGKPLPRAHATPDGVMRQTSNKRRGARMLDNQISIYDLQKEESDVADNQQTAC